MAVINLIRIKTAVAAMLIVAVLSACSTEPLPPERQRLLAFGAALSEKNGMSRELIYESGAAYKNKCEETLLSAWKISDGESAKTVLDWLRDEGVRAYSDEYFNADEILDIVSNPEAANEETVELLSEKIESYNACVAELKNIYGYSDDVIAGITTVAAFDCDRLVTLARWCAACGYLSEEELWAYASDAEELATENYSDWEQYFAAIELGRALTQGGAINREAADALLQSEQSPYKKHAFTQSGR